MASLGTYQACSPAEALHPSQGRSSNCAHRTCNTCVWFIASWNVRTLLDVEGSVETARQSCMKWFKSRGGLALHKCVPSRPGS